jgi:hypothetical protein
MYGLILMTTNISVIQSTFLCVCDIQRVPFLVFFSVTAVTGNPDGYRLSMQQSYRTQVDDKGTRNISEPSRATGCISLRTNLEADNHAISQSFE